MIPTGYFLRLPTLLAAMVLASVLVLLVVGPASTARADTIFTVKSSADTDGSTCGDSDCTLRQAINAANAASGNDTIVFDVGQTATTITLGSTLPAITDAGGGLTIDGGSASITVSGNKQVPVFTVFSGGLALKNLTVADGFLPLSGVTIGGGIYNGGTLEVTDSTFSGNSAPFGAAIANGGTLTVTNSTFSENNIAEYGGGIGNHRGGLTVINSTFSGNIAEFGSGIWSNNGGSLKNTIVANNSGENCVGTLTDGGYNIDDGTTCGFSDPTSKSDTDPQFAGGLADNGGPTKTIALLPKSSPAVNAIPSATNGCGTDITTDQRGVPRPQRDACDVGSYEHSKDDKKKKQKGGGG